MNTNESREPTLITRLLSHVFVSTEVWDDIKEAVAEIERLRKLIDGAAETGEIYERRLSECETDNERLRLQIINYQLEGRDGSGVNALRADIERLRGLLLRVNQADRHFANGAYWVQLYHDDFEAFDAALAGSEP